MRTVFCLTVAHLVALSLPGPTVADDTWPAWRGPNHNGYVPAADYPIRWGENENIAWKVKLPGWGTSTPAIYGDRIFVSCAEDDGPNMLLCLDRAGDKQWEATFGPSAGSKNRRKASPANPSPVIDGNHVFVYYKNGDLACVTFDGKKVWQINLQEKYGRDGLNWDLGTSPVVTRDFVVVAVMHQGPSYLVALEKTTGKVAWKQDRDLGAPAESRDSYSTPVVLDKDDQQIIIVLGADHVTAHKAGDGAQIWRVGNLNPGGRRNFRSIASPVVCDGLVVGAYARGETLTAITLGGSGDVTSSHVKWTLEEKAGADVPSPIPVGDRVYICSDRGDVTCRDVQTGKTIWSERLPRNRYNYSSSPVIVGDLMYATREDGTTFVLKVGEKPELVATNELRENTFASPAFAHGRVYLRTSDYLFCIGSK